MSKNRLEAFSDGVIAIIVTIMVLELKIPHESSWLALAPLIPKLLGYLLSFVIVAIMWVNHHHVMHPVESVDNRLLWANNVMLFWMSLIPFATGYMSEHYLSPVPVAVYGIDMTLCGLSFTCFRLAAGKRYPRSKTSQPLTFKDISSSILYLASIPLAFVSTYVSFAIFAGVALRYLLPKPEKQENPGA